MDGVTIATGSEQSTLTRRVRDIYRPAIGAVQGHILTQWPPDRIQGFTYRDDFFFTACADVEGDGWSERDERQMGAG